MNTTTKEERKPVLTPAEWIEYYRFHPSEFESFISFVEKTISDLQAENARLREDAMFLADVWVTIRSQGFDFIIEHGDPDGIDFVATKVINYLVKNGGEK